MRDRNFLILLFVLVVLVELPFVEYITDDTFIHLQFAKNLLGGHGFSFNAGQPTYGFTSPAWVVLIALVGATGAELLAASKVLGLLALILAASLFYLLALRILRDRHVAQACAVVWALNAWSVRWGISGMETSLVTAWSLLVLYLVAKEHDEGRLKYAPWALGIACLIRPEAILLLLLCGAAVFFSAARRRWRNAAYTILPGVVVALAWFTYAFVMFGTVWPNTVAVKAGRFVSLARMGEGTFSVAKILGLTDAPELILVACALVLLVLRRRTLQRPGPFQIAAAAWIVLLPAAYVLRDVQVVSRYLVPEIPFLVLFGFLALQLIAQNLNLSLPRVRRLAVGLAAVCVAINLAVLALVAYPHTHSFSRDMRGSLIYLGKWFSRNTAASATVAIPDIGAFAYYSDRKVLDLGGLISPQMIPVLRKHQLDEVMTGFLFSSVSHPDYVIDRARTKDRLVDAGWPEDAVTPLFSVSVSNLGITRPGTQYYTVYRVDWQKLGRPPTTQR